jgi:hypothetical protein
MPGFVDVSNMSSEDVRRMGHADDYDDVDFRPRRSFKRNPYGYNDANRPARSASAKYSVSDVWAAACAANRVNGGYFKEYVYEHYSDNLAEPPAIVKRKNRDIMMEFLADPTNLTVDDVVRGEHCRQFLQNDLTFRTLKNKTGEFDSAIKKVLAVQDKFDGYHHKYELAIVACLPQSVEKSEVRQNSESRVQFATGGFVGKVDDKVELQVEVLNSNFSKQYNIYWVRAITEQDQAVFFSSKESYDPGTHLAIKGTVKAHKDNLTQLNRVKVL